MRKIVTVGAAGRLGAKREATIMECVNLTWNGNAGNQDATIRCQWHWKGNLDATIQKDAIIMKCVSGNMGNQDARKGMSYIDGDQQCVT